MQEIGEPRFAVMERARARRANRQRVRREMKRTLGRSVSTTIVTALVAVLLVVQGAPGEAVWNCWLGGAVMAIFLMLGPIVLSDSPHASTVAWSRASQDLVSALRVGLSDSWTVLWDRHVDGGATVAVCVGPAGVWMLWTVQPGFDSAVLATAATTLTFVVPGVDVRWEWRQPWSSAPWRQVVSQMKIAPPVLSAEHCRLVVRQLMVPIATERLWSLRRGLRS
jgi:hypothetical protein